MMKSIKKVLFTSFASLQLMFCGAQIPKISFSSNETISYSKLREAYQKLDSMSEFMELQTPGFSDEGNPIHLMVVNKQKNFQPNSVQTNRNAVWLIMNGIHPGESEGIDASLLYLNALAKNPALIPEHLTILVIPVYNVDGMRNRKHFTRCGQNGPDEKGFRASAGNLDLNRDLIKADSRNTFAFYNIFQSWKPDVFLDTHTSNGADYQYTMTLITTQKEKLGGPAASFQHEVMAPFLYSDMKKRGYEMAPYVNVFGESPDKAGYEVFIESPKFSTGYTSLFGTLGFVAETHMLKTYPERVKATYQLLGSFHQFIVANHIALVQTKNEQTKWITAKNSYQSNYKVDRSRCDSLQFKGYELELSESKLGNYQRHFYNKKKPFIKTIPYYQFCVPELNIPVPAGFLVQQCHSKVIERLRANGIELTQLKNDTVVMVQIQTIKQIKYASKPYEGHFVHSKIETETHNKPLQFYAGDWFISTQQNGLNYLMEAISPQTWDGWLAWNFFDGFLNEKEGFSDYVFEDEAMELLKNDSLLQEKFAKWKEQNPDKLSSKYELLGFIYKNSAYYEQEYLRFPIYSIPR